MLLNNLSLMLKVLQCSYRGEMTSKELFTELREFMQGTIRDAYELVRTAWKELIRAHAKGILTSEEALRALTLIRSKYPYQ